MFWVFFDDDEDPRYKTDKELDCEILRLLELQTPAVDSSKEEAS